MMANEASIQTSMNIRKASGSLILLNRQYSANYSATVTGTKGPTPGSITVTTAGTDVDLSELTTPGLCWFKNMDSTNFVEYGIWEPGTSTFYPLGELLPGEEFPIRLSRNIREEYQGTGTGTTGPGNTLRFKANGASVNISVDCFEK